MKRITYILGLLIIICLSACGVNNSHKLNMKSITLTLNTMLKADNGSPITAASKTYNDPWYRQFPTKYNHDVPQKGYTVTFYNNNHKVIHFENVPTNEVVTFHVPAKNYDLISAAVGNTAPAARVSSYHYSYSLRMYGEVYDVDLVNKSSFTVPVHPTDAAILVVDNSYVNSRPTITGSFNSQTVTKKLKDMGKYYLIYSRVRDTETLKVTDTRGNIFSVNQMFTTNEAYRFMVCSSTKGTISTQKNILNIVHNKNYINSIL